ncbi:FAD-dependent oxidoreductase [Adlercreutzia equolifaciens]|uniref:FAD-dependent oxidoreductase n=1 Tax=Adlercreutzia equolifaciens TaxID=446660 RepID=UPI0023AFE66B|nr:FAD-dependent oxidoreductase [Adlercreutzia equolifaciens]MDE8703217.1 FAD-dependent oxidoreductase [Adlercreutzia equolifaciens]
MEITRRNFVQGALAGAAGLSACGLMACSLPATGTTDESSEKNQNEVTVDREVAETYDCDICIVGAGFSGLIAAVQAHELGANVLLVESNSQAGGSALNGIEGSFGIGSDMANAQNIEVDANAILLDEMEQSQWRADGVGWQNMMKNSGDNINWLVEQGVRYSNVDDYHGKDYAVFHWYDGGAAAGYVEPMTARIEELGIEALFDTKATELIQDDAGKVVGLYADGKQGCIQVNAKAVILATGGFAANGDLIQGYGYPDEDYLCIGLPTNDGSGHELAAAVGAKNMIPYTCDNAGSLIGSWGWDMSNMFFCLEPSFIWVNESGERFFKEDNCAVNYSLQNPPKFNQESCYFLWTQGLMEQFETEKGMEVQASIDGVISQGAEDIVKADTIEELAQFFGIDAQALSATVEQYNAACVAGKDDAWSKDKQYLRAYDQGPYYMCEPTFFVAVTIGSTGTNHEFQVVTEKHEPIEGLYAIGVEGCMLYRNLYTIGTPGSCSGNSINSARVAAQHAVETYC